MELKEFLSVRRAYGIVRQKQPSGERLTFEEFAILCRLAGGTPLKTSDIAEYQHSLRPTMTHRTNHLATLGLIKREEGAVDRRNIVCSISEEGRSYLGELTKLTCAQISVGHALSRITGERLVKYIDAMGAYYCKASDLVLLGLYTSEKDALSVMQIVDALGLLQPTVSMSVVSLADAGLVCRRRASESDHAASVSLTDSGRERAAQLAADIESIVVRRKPRKAAAAA